MSAIKKLAGQTLWYGLPTIAARFLGYLMNMALPFFVALPEKTADLVQVYTIIPFLNVLFAYGMETTYFRFSQTHDNKKLYSTLSLSLIGTTILFTSVLLLIKSHIVSVAGLNAHPHFVTWMIAIIAIDNLNTLPFARLRQENRPKRYAFARIAGIVMNISVVILFIGIIPSYLKNNPTSFLHLLYNENIGLGYYLIGNICGSLFTLLLLSKELKSISFNFDGKLWREAIGYSAPLIIVGLGGMINDMMSRLIYRHAVHLPEQQANHELGIFANIFRLALLITILIQAFRMAAEPFFFNKSKDEDAQKTYARVMKFFVIACCMLFLAVSLYLDIFRWIFDTFANPSWNEGLGIVPLLALGNVFLGIYYNLSIWYKLTNQNMIGAYITIMGAIITIALNFLLIPLLHYTGAAIATFSCYFAMMLVSYKLGQKYYRIPYAVKKLISYIVLSILVYLFHLALTKFLSHSLLFSIAAATSLLAWFIWFVSKIEAKEIARIRTVSSSDQKTA